MFKVRDMGAEVQVTDKGAPPPKFKHTRHACAQRY